MTLSACLPLPLCILSAYLQVIDCQCIINAASTATQLQQAVVCVAVEGHTPVQQLLKHLQKRTNNPMTDTQGQIHMKIRDRFAVWTCRQCVQQLYRQSQVSWSR